MSAETSRVARKPGRIYRGISEEDRRAERHRRLIETAVEAFGTRGIRDVSVRDICAASGYTPRYFYESFEDLDSLLEATVFALLQRLADDLKAALRDGAQSEPLDALRGFVRAYLEFLRKDPRVTRILMFEIYGMGLDMDRLAHRFLLDLGAELQPLVAGLQTVRLRRGASTGLVITGMLGAMVFIGTRWAATEFGAPVATVIESCLAVLLPEPEPTKKP